MALPKKEYHPRHSCATNAYSYKKITTGCKWTNMGDGRWVKSWIIKLGPYTTEVPTYVKDLAFHLGYGVGDKDDQDHRQDAHRHPERGHRAC